MKGESRLSSAIHEVCIAAIREAMGDAVDFGIDFHGRVSTPMARVLLRELAPFKPLFVEEPVLPEHWEYYRPLSDATSIPLAAGERIVVSGQFLLDSEAQLRGPQQMEVRSADHRHD